MKKHILILLTIIPVLMGYLYNYIILVPLIGTLFFYVIPVITLCYWFWLGTKFSMSTWNMLSATLIGNCIGLVCFALYFIEYILLDESEINIFIAAFSQMFVNSIVLLISPWAALVEANSTSITQSTITALQWISLILMIIIFMSGYIFGKVKQRASGK